MAVKLHLFIYFGVFFLFFFSIALNFFILEGVLLLAHVAKKCCDTTESRESPMCS